MQTLHITQRSGDAILGAVTFSERYNLIEMGRAVPCIRKKEDAEALIRCGFLDNGSPVEFNLLEAKGIREAVQRWGPTAMLREGWLGPTAIYNQRPTVGYFPADVLAGPVPDRAVGAIATTGPIGEQVAPLRRAEAPMDFWRVVVDKRLIGRWMEELVGTAHKLSTNLFAPPAPPISYGLAASPQWNHSVNNWVAGIWRDFSSLQGMGLLYSLPVDAEALDSPNLITRSLIAVEQALQETGTFYGVHIQFARLKLIAQQRSRVRLARELVRGVAKIAERHGVFVWVSNTSTGAPVMLDLGAAFASFHPGLTYSDIYSSGGSAARDEREYGKALLLWKYNLLDRDEVRGKGDVLDDTELMSPTVHPSAHATAPAYRRDFSKPHNMATMERLNRLRVRKVYAGEGLWASTHVGTSGDGFTSTWANAGDY